MGTNVRVMLRLIRNLHLPLIKTYLFLVPSCRCLWPFHWSQVLSWEWRCGWSSADRRCSNYIWVINKFIATKVRLILEVWRYATYFRSFFLSVLMDILCSAVTHGFSGLGKVNRKTRRETFKVLDLLRFILEVWRYIICVLWLDCLSHLQGFMVIRLPFTVLLLGEWY